MKQPLDQRVYLIDEDDVVRDSLKVLLESHGAQVDDFRSSGEFLAARKTAAGGCLVLGYNHLIVDGLELLAVLRRRGITLPAVFIVGDGNPTAGAAAMAAGASAYLERPIEEAPLICAIRSALRPACSNPSAGSGARPLKWQPTPKAMPGA